MTLPLNNLRINRQDPAVIAQGNELLRHIFESEKESREAAEKTAQAAEETKNEAFTTVEELQKANGLLEEQILELNKQMIALKQTLETSVKVRDDQITMLRKENQDLQIELKEYKSLFSSAYALLKALYDKFTYPPEGWTGAHRLRFWERNNPRAQASLGNYIEVREFVLTNAGKDAK